MMVNGLSEKERLFFEECKTRGLEKFYDKMVQHSLTKSWSSTIPHDKSKAFKNEIISLLEQYAQAPPVTEFTNDEQWYFAVEINIMPSGAQQSLIQENLEEFRLGDISPYSYRGNGTSPILLYKAKNNRGFALLNSYLTAGDTLEEFKPTPGVKELLQIHHYSRQQAHEPHKIKGDEYYLQGNRIHKNSNNFYLNVDIPAKTLMLENLALAGTEINYDDDDECEFQNLKIGAEWQDVPETLYLMYALGKDPSPQFYKYNACALNYPRGEFIG